MDDNISRQVIIDRLNRVIEHGVASKTTGLHPISAETVKEYVEALPPAEQRTGRWIPCKKRLPDDDMRVLVDDGKRIEVMKWDLMRGCFYDNHAHDYDRSEILAWMPLPEPYKEKEHETDNG